MHRTQFLKICFRFENESTISGGTPQQQRTFNQSQGQYYQPHHTVSTFGNFMTPNLIQNLVSMILPAVKNIHRISSFSQKVIPS